MVLCFCGCGGEDKGGSKNNTDGVDNKQKVTPQKAWESYKNKDDRWKTTYMGWSKTVTITSDGIDASDKVETLIKNVEAANESKCHPYKGECVSITTYTLKNGQCRLRSSIEPFHFVKSRHAELSMTLPDYVEVTEFTELSNGFKVKYKKNDGTGYKGERRFVHSLQAQSNCL